MDYHKIYNASRTPEVNRLQPATYVLMDTLVAPGSRKLLDALDVLMQLSAKAVAIRPGAPDSYSDELYPLEGVWEVAHSNPEREFEEGMVGKIMMRQPDELTAAQFEGYKHSLAARANETQQTYLGSARLVTIDEGLCAQIRHIGPYNDEPASFAVVEQFLRDHHLRRTTPTLHREIYLIDTRTAQPAAFETILRVQVEAETHNRNGVQQ